MRNQSQESLLRGLKRYCQLPTLLIVFLALTGCSVKSDYQTITRTDLHQELLSYEATLPLDHPHRLENLFVIDDDIKQEVAERFSQGSKYRRAHQLADWLIDPSGHGMVYDIESNLTPSETYKNRRGNCLSFTILMVTLANELGIALEYNDVDLPSMWDMDEEAGLIFYRHVNAIYDTPNQKMIFDLAMEDYDIAYPQRTFSARTAGALLHSNLGIQNLKKNQIEKAFHHLKLAVSIAPETADLWINLGVAYKRNGELRRAEVAFLTGFDLNDRHSLAASNLERLYREQGRDSLADKYQKLAARARLRNPYVQYRNALKHYEEGKFRAAQSAIRRAIRLHDQDPKFFSLRSAIHQKYKRFEPALKDLAKAFELSKDAKQRGQFLDKVDLVSRRAELYAEQQKNGRNTTIWQVDLQGYPTRPF